MFELVAILRENRLIKTLFAQSPGDGLAHERPEHQRWNQRKLMSHLKHDEDAGDRRAHDRSQAGAHADHCKDDLVRVAEMQQGPENAADKDTAHAAQKERWRKNSTATAKSIARNRGQEFCHDFVLWIWQLRWNFFSN